jgi:hypothetical protein
VLAFWNVVALVCTPYYVVSAGFCIVASAVEVLVQHSYTINYAKKFFCCTQIIIFSIYVYVVETVALL